MLSVVIRRILDVVIQSVFSKKKQSQSFCLMGNLEQRNSEQKRLNYYQIFLKLLQRLLFRIKKTIEKFFFLILFATITEVGNYVLLAQQSATLVISII